MTGTELSVPVTDEVTLRVRCREGAGSRSFLLVHGLRSSAAMWDEVGDRLAAEGHPVYAVDLRGHGESSTPENGYDIATSVSDLIAVSAALGLTGAVAAGHSWGAHVALRLAAEYPALVAGLGLVDGGFIDLRLLMGGAKLPDQVRSALVRGKKAHGITVAEARQQVRELHPTWSDAAIDTYVADLGRGGPEEIVDARPSWSRVREIAKSLKDEPPARWHSAVDVPVMILAAVPSEESQWSRELREWAGKAQAALPQATLKWYLDADHNLHAEHPERLAGDLLELARQVEERG